MPPVIPPASGPDFPQPYQVTPVPDQAVGSRQRSPWQEFASLILVLLGALLIAVMLNMFVFQSYRVDGSSMETTIQDSNYLIILKLPHTWGRLTGHPYVPSRGTIVVFNEQGLSSFGDATDSKHLIKRVVGLPGDRVVVKDGSLTIFNTDHPDGFSPDKTMPYGKVITTTPGNIDVTVGPGQVFVCGDNRPNSLDSRYFGTISVNQIVGKLDLRVYPFNEPHII